MIDPQLEVTKLDNLFTEQELQELNDLFEANIKDNSEDFEPLGRLHVLLYNFPRKFVERLETLVRAKLDPNPDRELSLVLAPIAAEYNSKYGAPQLSPHYDGDWTDLIIDFQLSSNTVWPIGVELESYELEDNSAVAFNPNKRLHWRQQKKFNEGEYVRMIFFRFNQTENPSNNDGIEVARLDDEHHHEVRRYVDSLPTL